MNESKSSPSHLKNDLSPKDMRTMILHYLRETGMIHSAFCYEHEAGIKWDNETHSGKLLSLVEKGFVMENLERESREMFSKMNKEVLQTSHRGKAKTKTRLMVHEESEILKKGFNLKEYISSKIQYELNKLKENNAQTGTRNSRSTFSSQFSGMKDDLPSHSTSYHNNLAISTTQSNRAKTIKNNYNIANSDIQGLPHTAFITTDFSKKDINANKNRKMRNSFANPSHPNSKQSTQKVLNLNPNSKSQNQIDFNNYNSKFSFANPQIGKSRNNSKDLTRLSKTLNESFHYSQNKSWMKEFQPLTMNSSNDNFNKNNNGIPNNISTFDMITSDSAFLKKSEVTGFTCHRFFDYKNYLLSFDLKFRKLALMKIDGQLNGFEGGGQNNTKPVIFKICEGLRKKAPQFVFDSFLIFYSVNEFIVFDYK